MALAAEGVDGVDDEAVDVVAEDVLGDGEGAVVGVAAAQDELGLEAGVGHGLGDGSCRRRGRRWGACRRHA